MTGFGKWPELALAGEEIQIRKGDAIVELRPTVGARPVPAKEPLTPREACNRTPASLLVTGEDYLREVREERLAAEDRRSA